jgi:hypothetical protein
MASRPRAVLEAPATRGLFPSAEGDFRNDSCYLAEPAGVPGMVGEPAALPGRTMALREAKPKTLKL